VAKGGRHLEHADGTPFFWLADTAWNGALLSTAGDWKRYLDDRATKHFALTSLSGTAEQSFLADTVRLTYHENPGAFLGLGAHWGSGTRTAVFQIGNGLFLLATAVLTVMGGAHILLAVVGFNLARFQLSGLLLLLAGGVSNLVDRVALGRVIDFLNVGIGPIRSGIFNIADVAILAGVALLIVAGSRKTYTPTMSIPQA